MSHLYETDQSYIAHLFRAWKIAFVLLVHGVLPNVWKTKASDMLCKERLGDDSTRAYLLRTMWNIVPHGEGPTPGVWDRLSTREIATRYELGNLERATESKSKSVKNKKSRKKK
jgi:hypothetical protein